MRLRIVGGLWFSLLLPLFLGTATASAGLTSAWPPNGYYVNKAVNKNVAYKNVPKSQVGNCIWCSTRHGNWFIKMDFVAKNGCANLYVDSKILNSSGVQIGTWYQKGGYVAPRQPIRLEFVTPQEKSSFKIVTIIC